MFATTQATTASAALIAEQRAINRRMAARARLMVEVTHRSMDTTHHSRWNEFFALEVGALLGLTRRKAELEVHLAAEVVERLPALWAAMDAGDLDWALHYRKMAAEAAAALGAWGDASAHYAAAADVAERADAPAEEIAELRRLSEEQTEFAASHASAG